MTEEGPGKTEGSASEASGAAAGASSWSVARENRLDSVLAGIRKKGRVGLMTHIVFGYPTVEASRHIVDVMVRSGVDLIELQFPFSDPTADGPVITGACQRALDRGVRIRDGMAFLAEVAAKYSTPFLIMSYFNVVFNYRSGASGSRGVGAFARAAADAGATGLIVPDIPPEERQEEYPEICRENGVHPIYVTSPNVGDERLKAVSRVASGLLYCTSRTGTTGKQVQIEMEQLKKFLDRAREFSGLPLAVGFSISNRQQIESFRSIAEVAVVGSHILRFYDKFGLAGLERELRILAGRKD